MSITNPTHGSHAWQVAALLIAATLVTVPSATAQVSVDVDITLQGITILQYYSNLDVTIDSTALAQMLGYGGTEVDEGTPSGAITVSAFPFSGDADLPTDITAPSGDPSAVDLTIENAWAVRSITAAGTNTVTTAITDGTLSHSVQGAGTDILISNARVSDGVSTGASIQFASPGLVNPRFGDVILELDLTTATHTGEYQDGVFTLVASTP
jgi:hypothetical protein